MALHPHHVVAKAVSSSGCQQRLRRTALFQKDSSSLDTIHAPYAKTGALWIIDEAAIFDKPQNMQRYYKRSGSIFGQISGQT